MSRRVCVAALFAVALFFARGARAQVGIQHARVRIDVRDRAGRPLSDSAADAYNAKLSFHSDVGHEPARKLLREGNLFVADGLLEGDWVFEVGGVTKDALHVRDGRTYGIVWIENYPPASRRAPLKLPRCESLDGTAVESFTFDGRGLGAGWLVVKKAGKAFCAAVIAGGGASLYLAPGAYAIEATLVGGKKLSTRYSFVAGKAPAPLLLGRRK